MNGKAAFTLEHALLISDFLGHTEIEREYFLLLVQKDRAGSVRLQKYFQQKIERIRTKRNQISAVVKEASKSLSPEDQVIYYSHWIYTALHMALMIPDLQNRDALRKYLGVTAKRINSAIEFLVRAGLATETRGKVKIGPNRIHLPENSPLINRHHANWRVQALGALDDPQAKDLHYSAIISISEPGAKKVRDLLLELVKNSDEIIMNAQDEAVYNLNLDFYCLDQSKV